MKKFGLYLLVGILLTFCGSRVQNDVYVPASAGVEIDSTVGSVSFIGKMTKPRSAHTATLLKNGNVLLCGGLSGGSLSSAEIYNPVTNRFKAIAPMQSPRSGHSATLLPDGKVLIAGGYNGTYLSSTEIFDPKKEEFAIGPSLTVPRSGHTATALANGEVLLTGGLSTGWTFLASAELYSFEKNSFTPAGSMHNARESHTATLLKNGNVLITGGHQGRRPNITLYSSAELYSSNLKTFSATGSMLLERHKHDAVLLNDGKVLITGGADERDSRGVYKSTELYDPTSGSFQRSASMNFGRYKHYSTSILLPSGNVLLTGGTNKPEVYVSKSAKFSAVPGSFDLQMQFSCATLLSDGNVLITGGYGDNQKTTANACIFKPFK